MASSSLLNASGLCVDSPAGRPLFRDLDLCIGREQVAVVGRNGVGKSLLLDVLAGVESAERGSVRCPGRRLLVRQILDDAPCASSPGERRLRLLEGALSAEPDLLLLDEPTDHLDFVGVDALETALRAWGGGLCVVSHDEEFLRSIGVQRDIVLGGDRPG